MPGRDSAKLARRRRIKDENMDLPIAVGTLSPRGIKEEPREKKAGSREAATQKEHLTANEEKKRSARALDSDEKVGPG